MNLNSTEGDEGREDAADDDDFRVIISAVGVWNDVLEQRHGLHQVVAKYDDRHCERQLSEEQHHHHLADADARAQRQINGKCRRHRHSE